MREHRYEFGLVSGATIAALVVLRLIGTQIYTEPWSIDPWLYTAFMANFGFTYYWFHGTYYAARLPFIIPGFILNAFLTPEHAYIVLHLILFLLGGVFVYLLVRHIFGQRVALFVYPAVLTNAMYVDAHTWDYVDGAVITYLAGGLYFLVSSIGRAGRIRPALAGLFLTAAAVTNLFATLLIAGAILAYVYGRASVDRRRAIRWVASDAAWFAIGSVALLVVCGIFARQHGGRLFFFMRSIHAVNDFSTAQGKLPTYAWLWAEPRLLIPLFVGLGAAIVWGRRRRDCRSLVGLAVTVAGTSIFAILVIWEFVRSGTFLQLPYYFDMVFPFFFVALATTVFGILDQAKLQRRIPIVVLPLLGLAAGAAPLVAVYGFNQDELWGKDGSVMTLVLMGLALLGLIGLRLAAQHKLHFLLAPLVAALAITSVNYASAASAMTHVTFETHDSILADADETFAMGMQLIKLMQRGGFQDSPPGFWYDPSADPALTGLQSLYFYGFTYLNLKMPVVDNRFRTRIEQIKPRHVVLLCTEPTCRGGPEAMRHAGYKIRMEAAERLHSGSKAVWVRVYELLSATPGAP